MLNVNMQFKSLASVIANFIMSFKLHKLYFAFYIKEMPFCRDLAFKISTKRLISLRVNLTIRRQHFLDTCY